jgi:hypothetical protein
MSRSRGLSRPRPVAVGTGSGGAPLSVGGRAIDAVREEWVVEDRWWTGRPVRRRYFELVLAGGRNAVVFRELGGGGRGFFEQRA